MQGEDTRRQPLLPERFRQEKTPLNQQRHITSDEAIERVGGNNCFQCYAALILTSCFCITGMTSLGLPWLEAQPDPVFCHYPNGDVQECEWKEACKLGREHFSYDLDKAILNWRTDYGLECADDTLIAFFGSCYFLGFMLTAPLWLRMGDVWGRRLLVHISIVPHILLTASFFFLNKDNASYGIILINTFIGLKEAMTSILAYVLLSEMVSARSRAYYSAANNIYDGLWNITVSLLFYFGRDWHYVSYFYLSILTVVLLGLFLVPESPRFLLGRRKFAKARAVYARIAKVNKRQMFTEPLEGEDSDSEMGNVGGMGCARSNHSVTSSQSAAASGIYNHPRVRGLQYGSMKALCKAGAPLWTPLGILLFLWISVNLVFYGIQIGVKDFQGNMLVNTSVSAVADMIGYSLAGFGANILGRKPSLIMGFIVGGVACLLYSFLKQYIWMVYLSVFLGKLGISFCFNVMYILTAETFPTEYRGTVFGATSFFARAGGFLAPFAEQLLQGVFMLIFAILSIVSAALVLCLRETKYLRMPDSLDEYFSPMNIKPKDKAAGSLHVAGLGEESD